jgi:acyl-CoA thioester hydrolase
MISSDNFRIYYEDTDAGGVVYYANYLKYAERARTEFLRKIGVTHEAALSQFNILFVIKNVEMELFKSAKLDDLITVKTNISMIGGAQLWMEQNIYLENTKICFIKVRVVIVNQNLKPSPIPKKLKILLLQCLDQSL